MDCVGGRTADDERNECGLRCGRRPTSVEAHSVVGHLYRGYRRHAVGGGGVDGAWAASHGVDCLADWYAGVYRYLVDGIALASDHYSDDGGGGVDLLCDARC
ncbi:hypothetical protein D3C79_931140 [compost metagenome]